MISRANNKITAYLNYWLRTFTLFAVLFIFTHPDIINKQINMDLKRKASDLALVSVKKPKNELAMPPPPGKKSVVPGVSCSNKICNRPLVV